MRPQTSRRTLRRLSKYHLLRTERGIDPGGRDSDPADQDSCSTRVGIFAPPITNWCQPSVLP